MMTSRVSFKVMVVLFSLCCAGCSQLFGEPGDRRTFYQIVEPESLEIVSSPVVLAKKIVIRPLRSGSFLNSYKIVFSDQPATRSYYKLAQWTETPPRQLSELLESILLRQNGFESIVPYSISAIGDLELHVELIEFYHDAADRPGQAVVELAAEIVSRQKRRVVARTKVRKVKELESFDSSGAVQALSFSSFEALQEIGKWLYEVASADQAEESLDN